MLEIGTDDVRALVDVGFIALSAGLTDQADTIFDGVAAARPDAEAAAIGRGLVRLARQDFAGAVEILRSAPPTDAVQTFLGLAYGRLGMKDEARQTLDDVINSPAPSIHADLARHFRGEMDAG